MTLSTNRFLARCEALRNEGGNGSFEPGTRIARGFADLGYEEFFVLPGGRVVSIFTGTISHLQERERAFFFKVPSVDSMISELGMLGWAPQVLECIDGRVWVLRLESIEKNAITAEGADLASVCLEALVKVRGVS